MLILQNAEAAIKRALDLLELAGPGDAPAHLHWIEARILLTRAWEEVRMALATTAVLRARSATRPTETLPTAASAALVPAPVPLTKVMTAPSHRPARAPTLETGALGRVVFRLFDFGGS